MPVFFKGIKEELRYMRNRSEQSMFEYFNKIKSLYLIVTTTGRPCDDLDIINTVIDGLGSDAFVDSLHIHETMPFTRMYHLLIQQEHALKR